MLPVIVIVGRVGVGKTTLFRLLSQSQESSSLAKTLPTRDRIYATFNLDTVKCNLVDTGGLNYEKDKPLSHLIIKQSKIALKEANLILFVVDGSVGVTYEDMQILRELRNYKKPTLLVVNKINEKNLENLHPFYALGLDYVFPISAFYRKNINHIQPILLSILKETGFEKINKILPIPDAKAALADEKIKISILGRPNVGKSTLINRLIDSERVIISNIPGTTLESIQIPYSYKGKPFVFIDNAGIRRRTKISDVIEKQSVAQSLQSINQADLILYVISAEEGLVEQDLKLISYITNKNKPIILLVNKWDLVSSSKRKETMSQIKFRMKFIKNVIIRFVSALKDNKLDAILTAVIKLYELIEQSIPTSQLNKLLKQATDLHQPPIQRGKRAKLRYAHLGGKNPYIIIIHGSCTKFLPESYQRYLKNYFLENLNLPNVPLKFVFKEEVSKKNS